MYPSVIESIQQYNDYKFQKFETYRVLHIDDDKSQNFFVKEYLEEDFRIKISSVEKATDLLRLIKTGAFDCVITDYDMPNMNGIQLSLKIRQFSNIPIVLYTGRGSEEIAQQAFEVGIDDYIRKEMEPAHFQILSRRVVHAVDRRRSNESYKNLFDSAADAIYIHDYEGNIFDVNRSACTRLGYTKEELLQMNIRQISIQGKHSRGFNYLIKELETKTQVIFESQSLTKDGRIMPVEINASVIKYVGLDAILSFCRDISERKVAEEYLRESEEKFSKVFYGNVIPMIIQRENDRVIIDVNDSFLMLVKVRKEDIIGKAPDLSGFVDQQARKERESQINKKGFYRNEEVDLLDCEGNKITVIQSADVFEANGVRYGVCSMVDITESRKKEKELLMEHEQFRNLLNSQRDGVAVIIEGETVFVNDSLTKMTGYDKSELYMRNFTELVAPNQRSRVYSLYHMYLSGNPEGSIYELEIVRKDQSILPVEVSVSLITYNGENALLSTIRDISERKRISI